MFFKLIQITLKKKKFPKIRKYKKIYFFSQKIEVVNYANVFTDTLLGEVCQCSNCPAEKHQHPPLRS